MVVSRLAQQIVLDPIEIELVINDLVSSVFDDFGSKPVTFVVVMDGASVFAADFLRSYSRVGRVDTVEYFRAKSYEGMESGELVVTLGQQSLEGKDVVILEDIVDTGKTMSAIQNILRQLKVRTQVVCTLLARRTADTTGMYVGYGVDNDAFVIGYGLDLDSRFRELPEIRKLGVEEMYAQQAQT